MSVRTMDAATMIAVSDPWVDPQRDRPLFESYPLIAGMVPIVGTAHAELLRVRVTPSENKAAAKLLSEKALALDTEHDDRYRGIYTLLSTWASVSKEKRRATIEKLIEELFPEGLAGTQRSYLAEAGNIELAASRLTPEAEKTLASIVVDKQNMLQLVNEWIVVGRKLGEVERERARLTETADNRITAQEVMQARYQWIRAVNALRALLELESDIPEDVRVRILQPLRTAEAKLARKRAAVDPTDGLDPTEMSDDETSEEAASGTEG